VTPRSAPVLGETARAAFAGSVSQPKRTLTSDNVLETVTSLVTSLPVLLPAFVSPSTSAALREKVFLGVTSVNDCRYCKWLHTRWSMNEGVTLEEVKQILGEQVESPNVQVPADAEAVRFGRAYAERLDRVDAEAVAGLRRHYSEDQADEILAYVRFITFANLLGNTADAFLDRLLVTVVGAAAAPVAVLMHLAAKLDGEVGMDPPSPWRRARPDAPPPDRGQP
jgi:AhpD family alkylhydroperoxidase